MDTSEEGPVTYRMVDRTLVPVANRHRRPVLTREEWQPYLDEWVAIVEAGGVALGAFVGDRLVGVAVLRFRLEAETAQLAALYVDRAHRRTGVAAALVTAVEDLARSDGARSLYVSATPSDSAVPFYLSRGFRPVERPHPDLFALEPDDIHMTMPLADQTTLP